MPRVAIRRPTMRDEPRFLAAAQRSRRLHSHFVYPPRTPQAFRALLRRARQAAHEHRLIVEAQSRDLVGVANLNEIVRGSFQSAYLGYYAFVPLAGKGLMREGLSLVLRLAFRELGLHRVEANIQPDNARSIVLARSLGFRREGYSPRYLKLGGRWRDHERWTLLREEWRPRGHGREGPAGG